MAHKCLITGVTGQTGSYLAAYLLSKGYGVEGTSRNESPNLWRLNYLGVADRIIIHAIDAADPMQISKLAENRYDKIYHLAAESSVAASLKNPCETVQANLLQTTAWLSAIRDHSPHTRFFNAASSEVLAAGHGILNENAQRLAGNPYAVTKLAAMDMCRVFRDSFDMYVVNGILFNHESELRDARFVTGKIITNLCRMAADYAQPAFELGNVEAERDFSHAEDFARGIADSLSVEHAQDYVFASGQLYSVRDFFNSAASQLGFEPKWSGVGTDAVCVDAKTGRTLVAINSEFYRPVDELGKAGDAGRAMTDLGWTRANNFESMIGRMIAYHSAEQNA